MREVVAERLGFEPREGVSPRRFSGPQQSPTLPSFLVAATTALILLLPACQTSTKLVTRTPDASLMVPCETPQMLPAKPTGNQVDKALVDTTRIALDCKAKHDGLIEFELAAPK